MSKNQKQDAVKEILRVIKGDYKAPGKALLWGMAVSQWMAIIVVGGICFILLVMFVSSVFQSNREVTTQKENTNYHARMEEHDGIIKEVTKFLEVSASSINERQETLERLTKIVSSYMGRQLDKDKLEQEVESLTSLLSSCNASRGRYIDSFSENTDPFEDPEISDGFKALIGHKSLFEKHPVDPQEERQRWKALCDICQNELNKANKELIKVLNVGTAPQENTFMQK